MQEKEIWKTIPEWESYEVSNFGNVRSIDRPVKNSLNRVYLLKGQVLKPIFIRDYFKVHLRDKARHKLVNVHRLVATAFIPNHDNLPCINHKDENKLNNHVSNLEWCTVKYNCNYGTAIERCSAARYKAVEQYDRDGNFIAEYPSITDAAKAVNRGYTNISSNCKGEQLLTYGYQWKLKGSDKKIGVVPSSITKPFNRIIQSINGIDVAEYANAKDAAKSLGISVRYVHRICHGDRKPLCFSLRYA